MHHPSTTSVATLHHDEKRTESKYNNKDRKQSAVAGSLHQLHPHAPPFPQHHDHHDQHGHSFLHHHDQNAPAPAPPPHVQDRVVKEKALDAPLSETIETKPPGDDEDEQYQRWRNPKNLARYGFERLGHMYTMGVPFRFEELQGRHPFDFVDETKDIFRYGHKYYGGSVPIEDVTLLEVREWMEPAQKGQIRWDYCRDKWLDKASRIGAACAPVGCLYSLWEITLTCQNNGGVGFMLVYFIVTVLFAIPFIYMELIIGQFHRLGVVKTLGDVCPLFTGLAYLMLFSCTLEYIMLMCRSSWLTYYLFACFHQVLPWSKCSGGGWVTSLCQATHRKDEYGPHYVGSKRTPAVDYFRHLVHRESISGFDWQLIFPNIGLLCSFFFLVFVLRQVLKLKCRTLGRGMLVVFTTALILCAFCLIARNYTSAIDHEEMYNKYMNKDITDALYNENAWLAAMRHGILGTGIGTGIHISFGSHNSFTNQDLQAQALLCGCASYILHLVIIGSFSIDYFTVNQTRRFKPNRNMSFIRPPYGTDTVLEIFPQVAVQFPRPAESWVMLTSMILGLLCLALLRNVCVLHTIRQYFCDKNKEYYDPYICQYNVWEKQRGHRQKRYTLAKLSVKRKTRLMTKFMLIVGIFTIATFFQGGVRALYLLETFWYKYMTIFIVLMEAIAILFFLGMRTLNDYFRKMTSSQICFRLGFLWKTITPAFPFIYVAICAPEYKIMNLETISFEEHIIFAVFCFAVIIIQLLSILSHLCRSRGITCWNKLVFETTPAHEQAGLVNGTRPTSRLHWVHHLCVPKLMRHKEDTVAKDNRWFFNTIMECLWFHMNFKWMNSIGGKCMVNYYQYDLDESKCFSLFPDPPFKLKPEKEVETPEYLPNRQIRRIRKMKNKTFNNDRKEWLQEKVVVEKEGVVVDMDKSTDDADKTPQIKKKEHIEVSSSSSSLSLSDPDHEESLHGEYGFSLHETYEAELQISDGESLDEMESNDWDDLSGDETDEDALALLRLDSYDDIVSTTEPSVRVSLFPEEDDELDEDDRKELEQEEKDKVNAEFLFEDIDAEQEIWEDSDVVEDDDSDESETDVTDDEAISDDSKRSHSPGSMSDNEILVDVIYTDSDVDIKPKRDTKKGKAKRFDDNADSWSDYSSSSSRSSRTSLSSVSSTSHAAPVKRRRVSFGATSVKTINTAVAGPEDNKKGRHQHHHHHHRHHGKKNEGQQPEKFKKPGERGSQETNDDDVLSGPYKKNKQDSLKKTLGRLKKKIMTKVKQALGH